MAQSSSLFQYYRSMSSLAKDVVYEFQKDIFQNCFFNSKNYLIMNSKIYKFNNKRWHLRPEFFAYDIYGSADLFHIVLLVNDISSRFNFRESRFRVGIYTPSIDAIRDVLTQKIQ